MKTTTKSLLEIGGCLLAVVLFGGLGLYSLFLLMGCPSIFQQFLGGCSIGFFGLAVYPVIQLFQEIKTYKRLKAESES